MRKFRVLLHKIPPSWAGLWYGLRHPVSGGIALCTWSKYTHVEIHIPDASGKFDVFLYNVATKTVYQRYLGTCYTSTLRGEYDGACKRPASEVLKNPERWDIWEGECEDEDFGNMIAEMDKAVDENQGYDKELIAWWWHKAKRVYDKAKYICTEFGQMALVAAKKIKYAPNDWWEFSANFLAKPLTPKAFARILPGKKRSLL